MSGAAAPGAVQAAAQGLRYRDFLTVALIIDGDDLFPDNWIYIHEPERRGRSHPELPLVVAVDGPGPVQGLDRHGVLLLQGRRAVGVLATRSSSSSPSARSSSSAWPRRRRSSAGSSRASRRRTRCTTPTTPSASTSIKGWLEGISNIQQVGRNGLHRYNNSDHSMLTAMRAVDNVMTGSKHDLWSINAESAYHEEHQEPEQPYKRVPNDRSTSASRWRTRKKPPPSDGHVRLARSRCGAILIPRLWRAFGRSCNLTEGAAEGFAD